MPASVPSATATEFLSVTEQADLIALAQDVPAIVATLDDGTETVRYFPTAAADSAFARLYLAFLPAIEKAARASKVLDFDEATAVAIAEFTEAVRDFETDSPLPFSATIATRLRYAVLRADLGNDLVKIKRSVAKVYFRLIHKHDGDFSAAYAEVKTAVNDIAPATFLAVHHVIGGVGSLDLPAGSRDGTSGSTSYFERALGASFEETIATEAEVAWLFTLVTDEEATILRLAYGFRDTATENLRVAAGFKEGEILTDVEISGTAVPLGRATVNRRRLSGLATMRAALIARALEEDAE